jgi:hypothetical protein
MGLIKKKDANSYFAAKKSNQLSSITLTPDTIPYSRVERSTSASLAGAVEVRGLESLVAESPVSRIIDTWHSGIALAGV